ncbi:TPA: endonuclease/exonuclease/phosphatase family protein [Streptococcus suis]|nr:endonuclease/exonuclease/phosphatase family protein [Streptococcus suis]
MTILNTLTWNINQKSGRGKFIPDVVPNEILNKNRDIVVLTEFYKTSNTLDFIDKLKKSSYQVFTDPRPPKEDYNEILIAVKDKIIKSARTTYINNEFFDPDFLQVSIVTTDDKILNIVGTRIKIDSKNYLTDKDFKRRKKQFDKVIEFVCNLEGTTIVTGDFNNGFYQEMDNLHSYKGKAREFYNYYMVKDMLEENNFSLHTPLNASSCGNNRLDHIAIRNGLLNNSSQTLKYDWNFNQLKRNGYPDHAILLAEFIF